MKIALAIYSALLTLAVAAALGAYWYTGSVIITKVEQDNLMANVSRLLGLLYQCADTVQKLNPML